MAAAESPSYRRVELDSKGRDIVTYPAIQKWGDCSSEHRCLWPGGVTAHLLMPRQAFLSQEEKRAKARERDRLKKRRRREDVVKRSLERQRNSEAMKRRREDEKEREKERKRDREAKRRRRENVEEREKERKKDREAKKRRRREKREEKEKVLYKDMVAQTQLWDREQKDEDEDEDKEAMKRRVKEQAPVLLGTPASMIWGTGSSQVPQSKYAELLAIIEELGKEIRPTYAGSKSAMERLKRGIIHARGLVRECLAETERNARS
ncbi:cyclin-dependent kinase 2-associated protein 1 isoform X1 [Notamacropus eugenii]|uniref:cyclin-dependent kinase 2-associated protein 1 isoform X1 n=1 Tax=Notamacropus eugenii TaxID=9315 RepID=UPI003B683DBD